MVLGVLGEVFQIAKQAQVFIPVVQPPYTEPPALLILETRDETVSAYYDMPELREYVESTIDRQE